MIVPLLFTWSVAKQENLRIKFKQLLSLKKAWEFAILAFIPVF